MNKICCIYAIKDKRNDKVIYVGQTKNFKQRKSRHFYGKQTNIDKYMFEEGRENFEMIVIEELPNDISKENMRIKEQYFIEKFNTINDGLNKQVSGKVMKIKELRKTEEYKEYYRQYKHNYFKNNEKYREYYREYYRQYREDNKEKLNEYNRQYRLKKKQEKLNSELL